jgi:KDO2-lipid IV(A) lauroyltransferase
MAPRPRRARRARLRRARLIAAGVRTLAFLFRALPWSIAQRFGRSLGWVAWTFSRRDRPRALEHLALAFPELAAAERRRIARGAYLHLGTTLGEVLWLFTRGCAALARHMATAGLEAVEAIQDAGRPILFITGHCGNWEMLAASWSCRRPVTVVGRVLEEPPLQRLVSSFRTRFGARVLERGAPGAPRELLRTLRRGQALAVLIDQDTQVEGVWIPFFGRPAFTPLGPARLARHYNVAVVPVFDERLADGSHLARFGPVLELPEDDVEATALMTGAVEAHIRRVPEQWVWMHQRWRRQPTAPAGTGGDGLGQGREGVGAASGGSAAAIAPRRASSQGGSTSASPRRSGDSSTAKPGPSVASSKSTPPGSRK